MLVVAMVAMSAAAGVARAQDPAPVVVAQADEPSIFLRLFGLKKKEPAPRKDGPRVLRLGPGGTVTEGPAGGNAVSPKRLSAPKPEVVIAPRIRTPGACW